MHCQLATSSGTPAFPSTISPAKDDAQTLPYPNPAPTALPHMLWLVGVVRVHAEEQRFDWVCLHTDDSEQGFGPGQGLLGQGLG